MNNSRNSGRSPENATVRPRQRRSALASPFFHAREATGAPEHPPAPLDSGASSSWEDVTPALLDATGKQRITKRLAWEWGLVCVARGLPCRVEHAQGGYRFFAPRDALPTVCQEIRAYERENHGVNAPAPPLPMQENTALTLGLLLLLAMFHAITQNQWRLFGYDAARHPIAWSSLGMCDCFELSIHDAWWRSVTALTLHADAAHLLGNLGIGALIMVPLCRELGSGAGWCLTILAGSLGNILNCALQGASHRNLGASTAVFGAIGVLCALRAARSPHFDRRSLLLPLGAGVMLLGFLGMSTAPDIDVGAHVCGFAAGVACGLLAGLLVRRYGPPGTRLSLLLAACAAGAPVLAWILAFIH